MNFSSSIERLPVRTSDRISKGWSRWLLPFFMLLPVSSDSSDTNAMVCLNQAEQQLYHALNEYRSSKGLPAIPISAKLCRVAQAHVNDLSLNQPDTGICNLHSWSANGPWTPCCYTSDHARATCMWRKPYEIAGYPGDGFEISYSGSDGPGIAQNALSAWKNSPGHNQVIINGNEWKEMNWKAVGIGIKDGFACVWFGLAPDGDPIPLACKP